MRDWLTARPIAHRGLHDAFSGVIENTPSAFRAAVAAGYGDGPKVMNGASDLMVAVFGDKGRHARSTVGVAALPADAAVEVEGTFEVA